MDHIVWTIRYGQVDQNYSTVHNLYWTFPEYQKAKNIKVSELLFSITEKNKNHELSFIRFQKAIYYWYIQERTC